MTSGDWQRLAREVTTARSRLGYRSIAALASASGLSTSTLDNIENARKTSYDPATLAILEHALGWQIGAVQAVLAGAPPTAVPDPDLAVVLAAWPRLSPGSRRMLRVLAAEAARAD